MKIKKYPDCFKQLALEQIQIKQKSDKIYSVNREDLLILKKCPLCGKSKLEDIAQVCLSSGLNFFTTAICANCLFIFRPVSPKLSWFKKCWALIRSDKLAVFNPKAEKLKQKRYQIYKNLLTPYISKGQLLDIGASYGTGSVVFRRAGFKVSAIEAEENKITYLTKKLHIPVIAVSIEDALRQIKYRYDAVIFSNCLEHLDFPVSAISQMEKFLKPDGIMLLAVPHIQDAINWADALYLTHKSYFTTENMIEILIKNGFEIMEMIHLPFYQEIIFIIRKAPYKMKASISFQNSDYAIDKIKKLYLKDLPVKISCSFGQIIKYTVPHIDQFFQTINLDKHIMKTYDNNIVFTPK